MPQNDTNVVDRRTFLRAAGVAGLAGVAAGSASGRRDDSLRLLGEVPVSGALEAVTQGNYAYVATGNGMAVVDWTVPGRPEVAGTVTASDPASGILDVKVDGDLASLAHNGGPGITLVDVSDPANPVETALYDAGAHVHNNFIAGDYAYVGVNDTHDTPFDHDRMEIVDVSDPTAPEKVGEWRLCDHFPDYAAGWVNPIHDLYVQDGVAYLAHWDAGTVMVDVSDPTAPETLAHFGAAPHADEPPEDGSFPLGRYLNKPGNAHYVQPTPSGDHVLVGAETFPGGDASTEDYGGIRIFDVSDLDAVEQVGYVAPPDDTDAFRTSHNFDVTANRLHASWYRGGARVYDITDVTAPEERAKYESGFFWTAVEERGFTVASDIGRGLVVLSTDRGEKRPPGFADSDRKRPSGPGVRRD